MAQEAIGLGKPGAKNSDWTAARTVVIRAVGVQDAADGPAGCKLPASRKYRRRTPATNAPVILQPYKKC
jgi:hypothetical protein